jgi:hypothetical protein
MATACWAFIVAKSTPLKTAPIRDFGSLQPANSQIHQQLIHNVLWTAWGLFQVPAFVAGTRGKATFVGPDSMRASAQSRLARQEESDH